ncbi:hypothetical protein ANCDUO_04331, partial [Ancylostoma duodenale]
GKIALMRFGEGFRGDKVYKAQQNGAIGAILFSDPDDIARDGTDEAHVYPNTLWMPNEGVQRGSIMHGDGDPLTPLYPSKKELFKRRTIEQAKKDGALPSIPVLPVSYSTAYQILSRMKGRPAPQPWQGAINVTYKIGPGFQSGEALTISVNGNLKDYIPALAKALTPLKYYQKPIQPAVQQLSHMTRASQEFLQMSRKFERTMVFTRSAFSQNPFDPRHIAAVNERLMK